MRRENEGTQRNGEKRGDEKLTALKNMNLPPLSVGASGDHVGISNTTKLL